MTDKQIAKQLDLMSAETEKALASAFNESRNTIKNYLADLYEKYAKIGVLSYSDMTKYNRMNALQLFLADEIKSLWKTNTSEIKTLVGDLYEKSYFEYGGQIAEQAGMSLNFGVVNRDTIASLINEPSVAGTSLIDIIEKSKYNTLLGIRQVITQGFIIGDSYQDMAKKVTEQFDKSFNNALRDVRTEGTRAAGEGQSAAYDRAEKLGVELDRIWVATDDNRTRPSHSALDGQVADEEGMFTIPDGYENSGEQTDYPGNFAVASENYNCRCRIRAEVKV